MKYEKIILLLFIFILGCAIWFIFNMSVSCANRGLDPVEADNGKVYFLTFGTTDQYRKSLERICSQAKDLNVFDDIIVYNETDLKSIPEFWERNKEFVESNKRGYGYWIWKPYLILKTLKQMKEGDVLVYCDCGSTLRSAGRSQMLEFIELSKTAENGILGFSLDANGSDFFFEKKWTKMDVFHKLNIKESELEFFESPQICATEIILCKNKETVDFVQTWYDICMAENYKYVTDRPSEMSNHSSFVENRHDQSIYSLMLKKTNRMKLITEHGVENPFNETFPIYNSRIKGD